MAGSSYKILDKTAPRRAADPKIRRIAQAIAAEAQATTPRDTGHAAGEWRVEKGRAPAVWIVSNDTPYLKYVEYGTRYMRARPFFGRIIARVRAQVSR